MQWWCAKGEFFLWEHKKALNTNVFFFFLFLFFWRGWGRAVFLVVSLTLYPLSTYNRHPAGGWQHLTLLSLWPACFLHPWRSWEPAHLQCITEPLWCLVLCLGSILPRMESAWTEELPFTSIRRF